MFYDEDGTLTNTVFSNGILPRATLTAGYLHLAQNIACKSATTPTRWSYAIRCDNTVTIKQIMFTQYFSSINVRQLSNIT